MTILELKRKTVKFAVESLKIVNLLIDENQDNLAEWLFYSSTQIGVSISRAKAALEPNDFILEMKESFSKASETIYWLDIIYENNFIKTIRYEILKYKCNNIRIEISKALKNAERFKSISSGF